MVSVLTAICVISLVVCVLVLVLKFVDWMAHGNEWKAFTAAVIVFAVAFMAASITEAEKQQQPTTQPVER
jgi:fructose-specific phosphotransferase system IIC component